MFFVSKPQVVEAIHWSGDTGSRERLTETFGKKVRFIPAPLFGPRLEILAGKDGSQDWVPVPLGHWVVRQPDDPSDIWPVDHGYFTQKYDVLKT